MLQRSCSAKGKFRASSSSRSRSDVNSSHVQMGYEKCHEQCEWQLRSLNVFLSSANHVRSSGIRAEVEDCMREKKNSQPSVNSEVCEMSYKSFNSANSRRTIYEGREIACHDNVHLYTLYHEGCEWRKFTRISFQIYELASVIEHTHLVTHA